VSLTMSEVTFYGFSVDGNGAIISNSGCLHLADSLLDGGFSYSAGEGGVIWTEGYASLNNVTMYDGSADNGGILCVADGHAVLTGCLLDGGLSNIFGGGVCVRYGAVACFSDCELRYNFATSEGGAIFCYGTAHVKDDTYIHNNHATHSGGGIRV